VLAAQASVSMGRGNTAPAAAEHQGLTRAQLPAHFGINTKEQGFQAHERSIPAGRKQVNAGFVALSRVMRTKFARSNTRGSGNLPVSHRQSFSDCKWRIPRSDAILT
jgi:hypothetical protein